MDLYRPCPGGLDKKIKFCCTDLHPDLEKIDRMLEAEQRVACLDHIRRLPDEQQDRACLLAIGCELLRDLERADEAEAAARRLVEKEPQTQDAWALAASCAADRGDVPMAVAHLQRALDRVQREISARTYQAIDEVSLMLLGAGHLYAARAHLLFQIGLSGGKDQRPAELVNRLHADMRVPLLFKDFRSYLPPPPDAPYKQPFDEAIQWAHFGRWQAAAERLRSLADAHPRQPAIGYNLATMLLSLGDARAAADALRDYAALDVPLDDAVEAEALAQLLESVASEAPDVVDMLRLTFTLHDLDAVYPKLLADRRWSRMGADPRSFAAEDQPPPREVFWLLDRPLPDSSAGLTRETAPRILADVLVFGRETDREARIELHLPAGDRAAAEATLREVVGEQLGGVEEQVLGSVPVLDHALGWRWRLPDDTPRELQHKLSAEQQRHVLHEVWPKLPLRVLDGKTPVEAAGDPAGRIRLLAMVLRLELDTQRGAVDFNELRRALGLPEAGPVEPDQVDLSSPPVARLTRLRLEALSDEQLVESYRAAVSIRAAAAAEYLGREIATRASLEGRVDRARIWGDLAEMSNEPEQAFEYLRKAREQAVASGKSPAVWMVRELPLRLLGGDAEEVRSLLGLLQVHWNEPGVAQAVTSILAQFGLLDPSQMGGRPAGPAVRPVAPGTAASGLWTPDRGAAPATAMPTQQPPEEKPKLWMPGD